MSNLGKYKPMKIIAQSFALCLSMVVLPAMSSAQAVNPWNPTQFIIPPNTPPTYLDSSDNVQVWADGNDGQSVYAPKGLYMQLGMPREAAPQQQPQAVQPQYPGSMQAPMPYGYGTIPPIGGMPGYPGAIPNYGYGTSQPYGYGMPYGYGNGVTQPYGYGNAQPYGYGYGTPYGYGGGNPGYGYGNSGGNSGGYPSGFTPFMNSIPSGSSPFFGGDRFGF